MTVHQAILRARLLLRSTSDAAELDADWLMLHVLHQQEVSYLHAHADHLLSALQEKIYQRLLDRRQSGEPLAYIVGWAEFYGRRFIVNKDALIPRPETEELVNQALAYIQAQDRPVTIADVGTGTGCVAITLLIELERKNKAALIEKAYATDLSPRALTVARQNAQAYEVVDKLELLQGYLLDPVKDKKIDLIVSNVPYVPSAELDHIKLSPTPETKGLLFEPRIALDGGADGRDFINELIASGIPVFLETQQGQIETHNLK